MVSKIPESLTNVSLNLLALYSKTDRFAGDVSKMLTDMQTKWT